MLEYNIAQVGGIITTGIITEEEQLNIIRQYKKRHRLIKINDTEGVVYIARRRIINMVFSRLIPTNTIGFNN